MLRVKCSNFKGVVFRILRVKSSELGGCSVQNFEGEGFRIVRV